MNLRRPGETRWSRRTILILLVLLAMISLSIRYPLVEHERYQTDSYFIHHLSYSIVVDGLAKWTYHPLSYVGYYPLSYPSGNPFLVAEFSLMSGLPVESSIYILNLVVAIVLCLGAFLVARYFVSRPELAVLVSFFVILGSRFVDTTYWTGSARGTAVAMMVLVIVSALASGYSRNLRMILPLVVFLIGCVMLHHMGILLLLFGVAYVLTYVMARHVVVRLRLQKRVVIVSVVAAVAALVVASPFIFFDYFWSVALRGMQSSTLAGFDSDVANVIVVAASSYLNQIGFVLVFALAYVWVLAKYSSFNSRVLFPVLLIVVLLPLFGEAIYISMLLSPFVGILASLWFGHALNHGQSMRRVAKTALAILVVVSLVHPLWSVDRWNDNTFASGDRVEVSNEVFSDAIYANHLGASASGICNVVSVEMPFQALTDIDMISGTGIVMALNGDVSREEVEAGIHGTSHEFPRNLYSWYEYEASPPIGRYVRQLMVYGIDYLYGGGQIDGASEYYGEHTHLVVTIDNRWSSEYVTLSSSVNAVFPDEVRTAQSPAYETSTDDAPAFSSYVFYQSELVSIFLVELPIPDSQ